MLTIVGVGSGDPGDVPVEALGVIRGAGDVHACRVPDELLDAHGIAATACREDDLPAAGVVIAPDMVAARLVRANPGAGSVPDRSRLRDRAIGSAVARLAHVGAHLRRECPWDREQTAETIVPHTVEEAFEVAEAVGDGDVMRQSDEIGDLLFQSVFLAQLLEEDGAADLGTIADDHADKLIARHPHVYGEAVAEGAAGVRDLWERQKRESRGGGIFHEMPAGLPALAYATKAQRRASAVGFAFATTGDAMAKLEEEVGELRADLGEDELGDVLFAAVAVARELGVDPEIAVRRAAQRFRGRLERAAELAAASGERFEDLDPSAQLRWYRAARED